MAFLNLAYAKRILAEAKAAATRAVLQAQGETARFLALLPQYDRAPQVTAQRLYIETFETILQKSSKVLMGASSGNLAVLPLEKLIGKDLASNAVNITSSEVARQNSYELGMPPLNGEQAFPQRNATRQSRE